jgi:PadR family transcriptional regulator, regulatory protein AphA
MEHKRTAYVILGILAIHDHQSGYEIRATIEQTVGFFWGESYGQLYPTLKGLVAEGLVAAEGSCTGRRARRSYSITAAGRACLTGWLAVPYRDDPPRDEFLLKLFFGKEAAPEISVGHIREFQQKSRRFLTELLQLEQLAHAHSAQQPGFGYWMLTLQYGLGQLRAALAWSDAALATLAAAESAPSLQPHSPAAQPVPAPADQHQGSIKT